ncbi:MAG: hypothetical protein ACR2L4_02725 [Actinomycetota bacterium]
MLGLAAVAVLGLDALPQMVSVTDGGDTRGCHRVVFGGITIGRSRPDNHFMSKVGILLVLALGACEGWSAASQEVALVRAAADVMEASGSFAVEITIDLEMPGPLSSVESTIHGRVDLSEGRSTFEARSSDDDGWTEFVVDGVAYHSGGEIVNAPDWCAVPLSNFDGNALIQTGPLFGDVPDLLRSASEASVVSDASTADSTAYRVTVPIRETAAGARVVGDRATVWLDDAGRPVRVEFPFSQPVAGSSDPAVGDVRWVLSDWGGAEAEVTAPSENEVEHFPDCFG